LSLLLDSSPNGRLLSNNIGGTYEYNTRDSILLGSTSYVTIPDTNWGSLANLTISSWLKPQNLSENDVILNIKKVDTIKFTRQNMTTTSLTYTDGTVVQTTQSSFTTIYSAWRLFDSLYYGPSAQGSNRWGWISAANTYNATTGLSTQTSRYFNFMGNGS
jgi:hypothetical protein